MPAIIKPAMRHSCQPPCGCDGCESKTWLLDGDLWKCPECGIFWIYKTLYMRAGCPSIWARPTPWRLWRALRLAGQNGRSEP